MCNDLICYVFVAFVHAVSCSVDVKLVSKYFCRSQCHRALGGWIAKWVASSVRVPKGLGSIPGGAKVLGTDGICKCLPVSVSSYVEVCLCLLCSVCIN